MQLQTAVRYFEKSLRHPFRAVRNGIHLVRVAMLDENAERQKLFTFLEERFGANMRRIQREFEASDFVRWTATRRAALERYPGEYRFGSTGVRDCEALYYTVRALRPRVVVETGVCYGASSSYILEALERNGSGILHSIDLGSPAGEPRNDFFVHPLHRNRWHLHIGDSRGILRPLLKQLGQIDHFHHDSLHTYEHMMWEYETARPFIGPRGAISSDDVNIVLKLSQPFQRSPFADFCDRYKWDWLAVHNFGLGTDVPVPRSRTRAQQN